MDSPIRNIRVSNTGRDQLIRLKRFTGIQHWNVLCRWAFCRSLAEPHSPSHAPLGEMSNVEMTWQVFAGPYSDVLLMALYERLHVDGQNTDDDSFNLMFRLHLHRGIAYLAGESVRRIDTLIERAIIELSPQAPLRFGPEKSMSDDPNPGNP